MSNSFFKLTVLALFCFLAFAIKGKASDGKNTAADTLYVVQVKAHSNAKVIESTKKTLMVKYPDKKFVTRVQSPNYLLMIGYFKTQAEAEEFKKLVEKDYPGAKVLPYEQKK
jgi:hypothetical protein